MSNKIVLVTGGFDPIHSGHIEYFKAAKALGDILVVGLNSDSWLSRKKGRPFMPLKERLSVIENLSVVDKVITFNDGDNTALDAIAVVNEEYPFCKVIFANGGDRTKDNIPELATPYSNIEFKFGVGGENKMNSSSWILEEWKSPKTGRPWGYYRVLHENGKEVKLKELTVDPGMCLSMQKHEHRSEFWFVSEGEATVYTMDGNEISHIGRFNKFENLFIKKEQWHRLCNEGRDPCKIIEIQYGSECVEEDIVRK